MPGLARKHLAAQLDNVSGVLTISGSYPTDPAASSTKSLLQERRHEEFRWEFRLPEDVAVEGILAKLNNGELTGEHRQGHCVLPAPQVRSPGQPAVHLVPSTAFLVPPVQLLRLQMLCQLCNTPFPLQVISLPNLITSPMHMLPAVSLPKIAKPELATMPILDNNNIYSQAYGAIAPTKPDAAAPRLSTDEDARPMDDHEVKFLVVLSVISATCWFVHASGGLVLHG